MNRPMEIQISDRESSARCPACNQPLGDELIAYCKEKHIGVHAACLREGLVQSCPAPGCHEVLKVEPLSRTELDPDERGLCRACGQELAPDDRVVACRHRHLWFHASCAERRIVRRCPVQFCGEELSEKRLFRNSQRTAMPQAEKPRLREPRGLRDSGHFGNFQEDRIFPLLRQAVVALVVILALLWGFGQFLIVGRDDRKRTLLAVAYRGKPKVIANANFQSAELAAWILDRDPEVQMAAMTFVQRQVVSSPEILAALEEVLLNSENPEIKKKSEEVRTVILDSDQRD